MHELLTIALAAWLAGLTAFVGGLFAYISNAAPQTVGKQELMHGIVAFGGGILIAAVAFALVPLGVQTLSPLVMASIFVAGGLVFAWLDTKISQASGSKAQFMAMLVDFIPEAISMGAVFTHNKSLGFLLALFIGAQNLPEGFNAYREIDPDNHAKKHALRSLFIVSLLGPLAAVVGFYFLQDQIEITAGIMSFAAGGILYLIFQDIAPAAVMRPYWLPPIGAVLGFMVGMLGNQLLGH